MNTRFYEAIQALATYEKGSRDRCVLAMQILEKMHPNELDTTPNVKLRLEKLRNKLGKDGTHQIGNIFLDKYEHTAHGRTNKKYTEYAKELFSIWIELEINKPA